MLTLAPALAMAPWQKLMTLAGRLQEPLQEELPPRRAAEKAAEAACQEAREAEWTSEKQIEIVSEIDTD